MLVLSVTLFFISMACLFLGFLRLIFRKRLVVEGRMDAFNTSTPVGSFGERVVVPVYQKFGRKMLSVSPQHKQNKYKAQVERAGLLKNIGYERWLARKYFTLMIVVGGVAVLLRLAQVSLPILLFMSMLGFALVHVVYRFRVVRAIDNRSLEIVRSLPFALDLITVSVEAGLSLDGAIARIILNIEGALSEEFSKTLKEMRMGIEKRTALRNMGLRCDIQEVSTLMSALIQADELGVSLGTVLRIEGAQLREKRKQAAKEKAMKAPIKMLFPLIFFIFPAIFVIILGPALLQIIMMF